MPEFDAPYVEKLQRRLLAEPEAAAHYQTHIDRYLREVHSAHIWVDRSRIGNVCEPVPIEIRELFRTWVFGLGRSDPELTYDYVARKQAHEKRLMAWKAGGMREATPTFDGRVYEKFVHSNVNSWIVRSLTRGTELALALSPQAEQWLPARAIEFCRARCLSRERDLNPRAGNLMLQTGFTPSFADQSDGPWIALMQFASDASMHWQWGDKTILQFWMRAADLESRRFENAICWVD